MEETKCACGVNASCECIPTELECNHVFDMNEVWDTDKIAKCTKCGVTITELTPKVKKK